MHKEFICPRCGITSSEYPALSRRDNKTNICSSCGQIEAFEDYENYKREENKK